MSYEFKNEEGFTELEQQVYDYIEKNPGCHGYPIMKHLKMENISRGTAYKILQKLCDRYLITYRQVVVQGRLRKIYVVV